MTMINLIYEQKKQAKILIDTAEELFATYGYDGTSLRMITIKAKMNQASVSYYFRSKEGLYSEIFKSKLKNLNSFLSDISNRDADDITKLGAYIEIYVENVAQNKNFHKILCREIYLLNQDLLKNKIVASSMYSHFKLLKKIVETGILNGVFKNVNVDIFSLGFFTIVTPLIVKTPLVDKIYEEKLLQHDIAELKEKIKNHFFMFLQK